jgi:hypothetical protein
MSQTALSAPYQRIGSLKQVVGNAGAVDENAHQHEKGNDGKAVVCRCLHDLLAHHGQRSVPVPSPKKGKADQADRKARESEGEPDETEDQHRCEADSCNNHSGAPTR